MPHICFYSERGLLRFLLLLVARDPKATELKRCSMQHCDELALTEPRLSMKDSSMLLLAAANKNTTFVCQAGPGSYGGSYAAYLGPAPASMQHCKKDQADQTSRWSFMFAAAACLLPVPTTQPAQRW